MFRKLEKKVNSRLKSNAGESISETLVALLISALALVMLAGAISAASHMVLSAKEKLEQYYAANELVVNMEDSTDDENAGEEGGTTMIVKQDGNTVESVAVALYENNVFESNPVVAYREKPKQGE